MPTDPQARPRMPWQLALTAYGVVSACLIVAVVTLGGRWLLDDVPTVLAVLIVAAVLLALILAAGYVGARLMRRWCGPTWGGRDGA